MILQWIQIDYQKVQTKLEVQKILKEGFHRGGDMLGKSWKIDGQRSGLHAIPRKALKWEQIGSESLFGWITNYIKYISERCDHESF